MDIALRYQAFGFWPRTISHLELDSLAGSFDEEQPCHPSGYLKVAIGLLTHSLPLGSPIVTLRAALCAVYPGLSQGHVLPHSSPKSLCHKVQLSQRYGISLQPYH